MKDSSPIYDPRHARELHLKREKGEIACAECRRLKIRCNKKVPCNTCVRRGCKNICPNASLLGKEPDPSLTQRSIYTKMSKRIRELEDALQDLQNRHYTDPHPLLSPSLQVSTEDGAISESIPTADDVTCERDTVLHSFGTLSISEDGSTQFFGRTGVAESMLMGADNASLTSDRTQGHLLLRAPICSTLSIDECQTFLPSYARAKTLVDIYFDKAGWFWSMVTPGQMYDELLPSVYNGDNAYLGEGSIGSDSDSSRGAGLPQYSLLYMTLSIGALLDVDDEPLDNLPAVDQSVTEEASRYHHIGRAALSKASILGHPHIETIQSLRLMSIYHSMSGNDVFPNVSEDCDGDSLFGLATHLIRLSGIHRDASQWGLSSESCFRRRMVYKDSVVADALQSLATGRPPICPPGYMDCLAQEDRSDAGYLNVMFPFAIECLYEISQLLSTKTPSYTKVLELDKKIQDFSMHEDTFAKSATKEYLSKGTMLMTKESVLIYMHTPFFNAAIEQCPSNPLKSDFAPSVLAVCRASSSVLKTVIALCTERPALFCKFWCRITFAFSAANCFGAIATRASQSPLAKSAIEELDKACAFFGRITQYSPRAAKALPILLKTSSEARRLAKMKPISLDSTPKTKRERDEYNDERPSSSKSLRLHLDKSPYYKDVSLSLRPTPSMESLHDMKLVIPEDQSFSQYSPPSASSSIPSSELQFAYRRSSDPSFDTFSSSGASSHSGRFASWDTPPMNNWSAARGYDSLLPTSRSEEFHYQQEPRKPEYSRQHHSQPSLSLEPSPFVNSDNYSRSAPSYTSNFQFPPANVYYSQYPTM